MQDEISFAVEENKTVIPVFYRDCRVPLQLRGLQYADFRTDYDRGLKTLLRTLEEHPGAAATAAASAPQTETKSVREDGAQSSPQAPADEPLAARRSMVVRDRNR